ncbi:MAG: hypothetical protein F6J93_02505 [Oscillatoria sp. SIO1A7]|nr:hypothetical protein [Oscillatoria sp. SIO1A7]
MSRLRFGSNRIYESEHLGQTTGLVGIVSLSALRLCDRYGRLRLSTGGNTAGYFGRARKMEPSDRLY